MDAKAAKERARLISGIKRKKKEIEQIFLDVAHWNRAVRTPFEKPIDPDPDGMLKRILSAYNKTLAHEALPKLKVVKSQEETA